MASIFDILGGDNPLGAIVNAMAGQTQRGGQGGLGDILGSVLGGSGGQGGLGGQIGSVLSSIAGKAGEAANAVREQTPGGMGGLMGAGALGAVLGNLLGGNAVKGIALAGASAVAWNFIKKWAAEGEAEAAPYADSRQSPDSNQFGDYQDALPPAGDDVSNLVIRSMVYAARADGTIQPEEKERIDAVIGAMLPGANSQALLAKAASEPIDPATIARDVKSQSQADDVYRLSCSTIDIDHFAERGYLDALAKALNIDANEQKQIEAEAEQAKRSLMKAVGR